MCMHATTWLMSCQHSNVSHWQPQCDDDVSSSYLLAKPFTSGHMAYFACINPSRPQELDDTARVNSKLQQGIQDSFEVLGHYMRGLPTLHHQHRQQQSSARGKAPIVACHRVRPLNDVLC